MKIGRKDAAYYAKLRKQFISAYGYYLYQTTDTRELERIFLAGGSIDEHVQYPNLDVSLLEKRLSQLHEAYAMSPESYIKSKAFINQRILETTLLLRQAETINTKKLADDFSKLNRELFGAINPSEFTHIFGNVQKGRSSHFSMAENSILRSNSVTLSEIVKPMATKAQVLIRRHGVERSARTLLRQTGMYKRGWRVIVDPSRVSSVVAPHSKRLILGSSLSTRVDPQKATPLLLHELTHVLRSKYKTAHISVDHRQQQDLASFEEGLAHAVERLSAGKTLIPARYWRYLAIGLSWGLDTGTPRTGREVFDILMPLYAQYAKDTRPEHYIFGTIVRIWKGTPLSVAGGALTKDVRYVHGSLLLLEMLSKDKLTTKDFRYLMTHKVK